MQVIYQAGPLFTEGERDWHRKLLSRLELAGYAVVWPGNLLSFEAVESAGENAPKLIFSSCKSAIDGCDCVVALLDGTQTDDGTAWEIGYAHAKGLPVFGIRTDFRQAGDTRYSRMNSMIEESLAGLAQSVDELIALLREAGAPAAKH